jgi:hypothetical protein
LGHRDEGKESNRQLFCRSIEMFCDPVGVQTTHKQLLFWFSVFVLFLILADDPNWYDTILLDMIFCFPRSCRKWNI